jgi:heat shock protein HslJ
MIELDTEAAPGPAAHSVQGNTGCNSMRGSATLDGTKLSFGPIATTKRYCPQTAGIETALLAALKDVQSWSIEGEQMRLLDSNGASAIALRAVVAAP